MTQTKGCRNRRTDDGKKWFYVDIDCHTHMRVAIKTRDEELARQDAEKLVDTEQIDLLEAADYAHGSDSTEIKASMEDQRPPKSMLRFHEVSWGQLERIQ